MSRFDQDREDLIRLIISICDFARFGYNVSTCNNCNNCGAFDNCEHKPKLGQNRWNCPLWKSGEAVEQLKQIGKDLGEVMDDVALVTHGWKQK